MSYIDPGLLKAPALEFSLGAECAGLGYSSFVLETLVDYVDEVTQAVPQEPVDWEELQRNREYGWLTRIEASEESEANDSQDKPLVQQQRKALGSPSQEPQFLVLLKYSRRKLIKRIRSTITPMKLLISNPVYRAEDNANSSPSPPADEPPLAHKTVDSVYYSKLNALQLSVLLKLDGYSVELTRKIEDEIMNIFAKYCNFDLGYSTWIRSTSRRERCRHIELLYKIFRKPYPNINRKMIEVIIRRGTYRIMQRRLRQARRARASQSPPES